MDIQNTVNPYVVVVGAVNIDIGGRSASKLIMRDSNPGRVRISLGGVGRNIAHNMRLLGLPVRFITALGTDMNARTVHDSCAELGIDISDSLTVDGGATSTYLFITGPDGDMELALSDMEIYSSLSPEFFESKRDIINGAELVVMETNLPEDCIEWLGESVKAPIFADPVSTSKAGRLRRALAGIHTLKPNRYEAETLTGISIDGRESLDNAADALLSAGVQRVFISLGADGVYACDGSRRLTAPCYPTEVANATGGGDALTAALALSYILGFDLEESARAGMAAASLAVECQSTINAELSKESLFVRMGKSWLID